MGRCYPVWMDFSKCMSEADSPQACAALRDDYLECLHHRKEARTHIFAAFIFSRWEGGSRAPHRACWARLLGHFFWEAVRVRSGYELLIEQPLLAQYDRINIVNKERIKQDKETFDKARAVRPSILCSPKIVLPSEGRCTAFPRCLMPPTADRRSSSTSGSELPFQRT